MYRIGEFSKLCLVPVSAIRYWADIGLLQPGWVDPDSGYRYYSADQLPRLNRVLALKDLGLSLDEIKAVLDEGLSPAELRGMLRLKRAEIGSRLEEEQARLERVEVRLRLIEKEGVMPDTEVVLKQVEPIAGLAMRGVLPATDAFAEFIGDGFAALGSGGVQVAGPPMAIYHDEEFTGTDIDVEMVYPVGAAVKGPLATPAGRKLESRTVPAGTCGVIVHTGPYERLHEAYQTLAAWVDSQGYRVCGPPQERYLSGPDEPGPNVTEIRMPVEKA